jgi:hypothetical protein
LPRTSVNAQQFAATSRSYTRFIVWKLSGINEGAIIPVIESGATFSLISIHRIHIHRPAYLAGLFGLFQLPDQGAEQALQRAALL